MFVFQEIKWYGKGNPIRIVAVDCGIKHNMIRSLVQVKRSFLCACHGWTDTIRSLGLAELLIYGLLGFFPLGHGPPGGPSVCIHFLQSACGACLKCTVFFSIDHRVI